MTHQSPTDSPSSGKVHQLFLDMNSYFASCEQQAEPALRGRPVAVVPMMSDATCAIAASYEAKAFGISTGTRIYDAKRLCPELICVPARHDLYVDYHEQFLNVVDQHLPVSRVMSIDEVACELDKVQQQPEVALQLARDIKHSFRTQLGEHLRCSIGLSTNSLLAKIATDLQKPDGLVILMPDDAPRILADKPLRFLPGVGPGMEARLLKAGIYTIPDLYRLEMKAMRRLWGSVSGERYWYGLRGVELPPLVTQKRVVGHSHVLDPDHRPVAAAEVIARRLLLKAASRLRRYEMDATRLTLSFRLENTPSGHAGPRYAAELHFHRACDNIQLIRHFHMLWHQLLKAHPIRRMKKVSIALHGLIAHSDTQMALFDNESQVDDALQQRFERLSFAMDGLNKRYGRDTITLGSIPQAEHRFSGTKIAFSRIPEKEEFHE